MLQVWRCYSLRQPCFIVQWSLSCPANTQPPPGRVTGPVWLGGGCGCGCGRVWCVLLTLLPLQHEPSPPAPPSPASSGPVSEPDYTSRSSGASSPPLPPPPPSEVDAPPAIPPHFMEKGQNTLSLTANFSFSTLCNYLVPKIYLLPNIYEEMLLLFQ